MISILHEDFSGYGDPGCDSFKVKGEHFTYWSRVGAAAYRFSQELSDDVLKEKIGEALDLLGDEVHKADAWRPRGVLLSDGSVSDATAFLGRWLVPRRLRQKGPNVRAGAIESGGDPLPSAVGVVQPAPEGFVWVAAEPLGGLVLGQEVSITPSVDVQLGERTAMLKRGDHWTKAELVRLEDCADFAERRRLLFGGTPLAAPSAAARAAKTIDLLVDESKGKVDSGNQEEIRTLWVDYDEHAERFKRWRDVCKESFAPVMDDKPIDGPLTALHFIKHAERHGGDVRQWLQLWCRSKHIDTTDRVYHELKVLTDSLHYAGCHDQLNIPALICMEVLCRRVQSIAEAYTNPARPTWEHAKVFQGQGSPEDIVSPVFRTYAAKKNKDELELLQARQKVRELRGSPVTAAEDGSGEAPEGAPHKPPKGPKKGRGRGQETG